MDSKNEHFRPKLALFNLGINQPSFNSLRYSDISDAAETFGGAVSESVSASNIYFFDVSFVAFMLL